jgi:tetratricopeptide (TPR) repeat protein
MPKKTCFVVMGFGTKTDYTKPKTFNLDKTYQNIIKPAAKAAGLKCVRADEIVHSGNINVPMYEQLLKADVVVADVSTYNCNAFYELGVRHALKPYTTIIISEDGLTFPFDVGQIAIKKYRHMGEGIDYDEVERMKKELTSDMKKIVKKAENDSPVYTFMKNLKPPMLAEALATVAATLPLQPLITPDPASGSTNNPTISILMQQAEEGFQKNNFIVAKARLADLHEMMPNDISVVQKLALATYKAKLPTEKEALEEARKLLEGLNPSESTDTETLGLLQAVHKTLWSLTGDRSHLDKAIWSSEKGFYLKNDYYNGINLAYLYNVRASVSAGPDAVTDFVLAQRTRRRVVEICQTLLDQIKKAKGTAKKTSDRDTKYWLLATLAEAWTGLGDEAKSQEYQNQALALNPPQWMIKNPREQLKKLRELLADSPLKSELNPTQAATSGPK